MDDYVKETLIASPYPFWLIVVLFAIISGLIQYIITFFQERARRKVEKDTVTKITDKIESVKDSYNKSLESHKIELQKDFESYKYITALCNSIDKELLRRLIKCKSEIESDLKEFYETSNIGSCETSITHLCNYLKAYNTRYGENENVQSILQYNRNIERLNEYEDNGDSYLDITQFASEIDAMLASINHLVAQFLPKFQSAEAQAPT